MGRTVFPDFSVYEGNYESGLQEGKGILTKQNGFTYSGFFKAGQAHGSGKESWPDETEF